MGSLSRRAEEGPFLTSVVKSGDKRLMLAIGAASDGLLFGVAPYARYRIGIVELADGTARVVSGDATPFPSIEVWQYGDSDGPRLVYFYDAQKAGTSPGDLFRTVALP
jgi:hypothetical protein